MIRLYNRSVNGPLMNKFANSSFLLKHSVLGENIKDLNPESELLLWGLCPTSLDFENLRNTEHQGTDSMALPNCIPPMFSSLENPALEL